MVVITFAIQDELEILIMNMFIRHGTNVMMKELIKSMKMKYLIIN